jgi:tetratricopeptide (TPR) repeat protein
MSERRRKLLLCIALAALTLLAYAPVYRNGFVDLDDGVYVTENPAVQAGLTARGFRWDWTSFRGGNWHPLTWLSLQLDAQLYHLRPAGYHLTNLLLHMAGVLLLFALLTRMTAEVGRSACVAGLFAVHPLHVESVAWVAERKDVLSMLFCLLCLWAYVDYATRPSLDRYLRVVLALAAGLLCKPMLVTVPCLLMLLDYWPLGRLRFSDTMRLLWEKLPLFALSAAVAAITLGAQETREAVWSLTGLPLAARLANAAVSIVWYLAQTFWPHGLIVFYPLPRSGAPVVEAIGATIMLVAITAAALMARRRPYLAVGWLWFLVALVPVIGLVQVGDQARADRYTYLPHIGLFLALVWGGADLVSGPRWTGSVRFAGATALLVVLAAATRAQVEHWRDSAALWQHALRVAPDNQRAHLNLGADYLRLGRPERATDDLRKAVDLAPDSAQAHYHLGLAYLLQQRFPLAGTEFQEALRLQPDLADAAHNLGLALLRQGKVSEAVAAFEKALALEPRSVDSRSSLGQALYQQGKLDEAREHLRAALAIQPSYVAARQNLGVVELRQGKPAEAEASFRAALELNPRNPDTWSNLGVALGRQSRWRPAIQAFQEAVRHDGKVSIYHRNLAQALYAADEREAAAAEFRNADQLEPQWQADANAAAWELATQPDPRRRDPAQAIDLATQVCQATLFGRPEYLDTLAIAYAAAGRFPDAVAAGRQALTLAQRQKPSLVKELEDRLRLYQAGRPYLQNGVRSAS